MSSPRFQPLLMPDTTRSGNSFFRRIAHAEVDAVGRRAVDAVDAVADRFNAERPPQRQRMADRARLLQGRHDEHLAKRFHGIGERVNPVGRNTIVIGNKN